MPALRAVPTVCLVLAAAMAGMLFAPVFGVPALLLAIAVPAAAVLLVALLSDGRKAVRDWRALLAVLAGLLAVTETVLWSTTTAGLPTVRTVRALAAGVTDSWQLALQSTWPARPDPALLLFVPLLVVFAAVLGVELLDRARDPLVALLPSFAVVLLSQLYAALPPRPGAVAALGYATIAGTVLVASRTGREDERRPVPQRRVLPTLAGLAPPMALAVLGALLAGALLPAAPARYSLRQGQGAPLAEAGITSPLDEIAGRLTHPGTAVFRVGNATDVDRWSLVVLDEFDGVNWTPGERYRRLGAELRPSPAVTVPLRSRTATIDAAGTGGPWLPSQTLPAEVQGIDPLVAEGHGTLLLPGSDGTARYELRWWQPQLDTETLADAGIDPLAPLGGVGVVPPGVAELAGQAVRGMRPSFQTALVLEDFFRKNYRLAVGQNLPTGHAWPQLTDFLLHGKRGTSEQFAAAYVALARMRGIPARLTVGFRAPTQRDPDGWYTVRNGDVLAWPEVAVQGIGWVPLDPGGAASESGTTNGGGLAALAERVRAQLPAPEDLRDPPVSSRHRAGDEGSDGGRGSYVPWAALVVVPVALLVGWSLGVPAIWSVRSWRRRRRPGAGAVVGAWEEVRDRLRAYGVVVSPGMTIRDLGTGAAAVTDRATVAEIRKLGSLVDQTLWSGTVPGEQRTAQAWAAVRAVRRGLARRGWRVRLRALFDPRGLLPPR
ncbi:transglutaminase-like domain-containing protein [Micromonospora pisi]|nr:transglutaminase-like domain-containing protein [Micromonospora pisi]